jgi:hypothetical protein
MYTLPLLWMADRVRTATRMLHTRLQGVRRPLRQALARRQRVPTPRRIPHALRRPSTYLMLVESDVRHGLRGILP